MYHRIHIFTVICTLLTVQLAFTQKSQQKDDNWVNLIDKKLTHWDIFMGAPHTTTNIDGYEKFDDVTKGKPIGLHKDPLKVFSVIDLDGEEVIKITGEIYAGLVTKENFENYHLIWEFKWGDKKWEPRLNAKRNSGILYHSVGDYTDFWNVWMTSLECEVQQTDCGDFITIGSVKAQSPAVKKDGKYYFTPGAELKDFSWGEGFDAGRCFKNGDPEKKHGKWNTMELICYDDIAIHVLNGKVVMMIRNGQTNINGDWEVMKSGKIQIQSEGAELYYKNINIKSINEIPDKYAKKAGI